MTKHLREIVKALERDGFKHVGTARTGKGHFKLRVEKEGRAGDVIVASTPGTVRTINHAVCCARRKTMP